MAWSTHRRATIEDMERLDAAALRFARRHGIRRLGEIGTIQQDLAVEIDVRDDMDGGRYLATLWRRCVRRALRDPQADGIGYGYVGHQVD